MPRNAERRLTKKAAIQNFLRERNWPHIERVHWEQLRAEFPNTSETTTRTAIAELDLPIAQPFAGLATNSLEALETSLLAMTAAYALDPATARECRAAVIAAKDRTRFASLNPKTAPEKRTLKEEMLQWMLVWLGDPALFPAWVQLRRRTLHCNSTRST